MAKKASGRKSNGGAAVEISEVPSVTPAAAPGVSSAPDVRTFRIRNLWHSGWSVRVIVLGCLISFLALNSDWTATLVGGGYGVHGNGYRGWFGGHTAEGENAYDLGKAALPLFLLAASVLCCARRVDAQPAWPRNVPLICAVLLIAWAVDDLNGAYRDAEAWQHRPGGEGWFAAPAGQMDLIIGQIIAGIGGWFLMRRAPKTGTGSA